MVQNGSLLDREVTVVLPCGGHGGPQPPWYPPPPPPHESLCIRCLVGIICFYLIFYVRYYSFKSVVTSSTACPQKSRCQAVLGTFQEFRGFPPSSPNWGSGTHPTLGKHGSYCNVQQTYVVCVTTIVFLFISPCVIPYCSVDPVCSMFSENSFHRKHQLIQNIGIKMHYNPSKHYQLALFHYLSDIFMECLMSAKRGSQDFVFLDTKNCQIEQ